MITKPPEEKVVNWMGSQVEDRLYLSAITIGEIVDVLLVWGKLVAGLELAGKAILTFPAFLLTNH